MNADILQQVRALICGLLVFIGFLVILFIFFRYCFLCKKQSLRRSFLDPVRGLNAEERLEKRVPGAEFWKFGRSRLFALFMAQGHGGCMD